VNARSVRRGFAIATALFTLVVIGALAMGTLYAATHELRAGSESIHQARAVMAAEWGVEQTVAAWSRQWNGAFGRGYGRSWVLATDEGARVTIGLTRLGDALFLITSDARAGPARRRIARIVRLDVDDPPVQAALFAAAAIDTTAAPGISGSDRAPSQWDCPAPGSELPAIAFTDTTSALRFGHFDWPTLVGLADSHVTVRVTGASPRVSGEECDTSAPENWGEPNRWMGGPCTGYYPVIHAASDLVIDGGRGQGVLIVEGNLTVQGGFEFAGAVLVRGAVIGGPGGGRITGAMSVVGAGATSSSLEGMSIELSRCAARNALLGIAMPVAVVERSWSDWFYEQ
jgi:hypothetical protein